MSKDEQKGEAQSMGAEGSMGQMGQMGQMGMGQQQYMGQPASPAGAQPQHQFQPQYAPMGNSMGLQQAPQGFMGQPQFQPQYQPQFQAQGMGQPQYAPMGGGMGGFAGQQQAPQGFMGQPQYQPQFQAQGMGQPQYAPMGGGMGGGMGGFAGQQQAPQGFPQGLMGQPGGDDRDKLHDKNQYGQQNGPDMGQMYGMVQDVLKGDADPGRIMSFLQASGGDFWKGAIVGAAAVLLLTNGAVKDALAGVVGSLFGQSAADQTGADAPEAEEA